MMFDILIAKPMTGNTLESVRWPQNAKVICYSMLPITKDNTPDNVMLAIFSIDGFA